MESSVSGSFMGFNQTEEEEKIAFNRNKAAAGAEGQFYKIKLAIYFLLKGLSEDIESFHLASNLKEADKFHDIVFKYRRSCNGASKMIFLLTKHKDAMKHTDKKSITMKKLFSKSDDFCLHKYFSSFLKIREQFSKLNSDHVIFGNKFEECDFILYSNAPSGFSVNEINESEESIEKVALRKENILNLYEEEEAGSNSYYKLVCSNDRINKAVHVLQHSSNRERLESQFQPQSETDMNERISENRQFRLVETERFTDIFQDKSESTSLLPERIKSDMGNTDPVLKSESSSIKLSDKQLRSIGVDEREKTVKVWTPLHENSEDDVKEFFGKFRLFLDQPNEKQLGEIIKRKMQEMYGIAKQDIDPIFANVEYKIRMWWQKGNYYLTKDNRFFQDAVRVSFRFDIRNPVVSFTGRVKKLEELHEILQHRGQVAITGLGGIGKSELSRKYINMHSKDYDDNVIWINAETYQSIEDSFMRLAEDKLRINTVDTEGKKRDIVDVIPEVYAFFAGKKRKCLFIFDNATKWKSFKGRDEGIDIFLPSNPHNKPFVLITSRNQEWGDLQSLPLGVFKEGEAIEFIRKTLESDAQETEMKQLAETLQFLPLALRQAVAYINMENRKLMSFTIGAYLCEYKEKALELFVTLPESQKQNGDQEYDRSSESVVTTWTVTVEKIKQKICGTEAIEILNTIAYLAPDEIPVVEFFSNSISNDEVLYTAVELLHQYSIASLDRGKLNIHRLVQQVTRRKLEERSDDVGVINEAMELVAKMTSALETNSEHYTTTRKLVPHFEALLSHVDYWLKRNPSQEQEIDEEKCAILLESLNSRYTNIGGNPMRQVELCERALMIAKKRFDSQHYKVAQASINLGSVYSALGDPQKGKILLEYAQPILERDLGQEHFHVGLMLGNLGNVYGKLGDHERKRQLLERALKILEKHYGPEHVGVSSALMNLGTAYGSLDNYEKQKELLERALDIEEKFYGPDHFEVARILINLGTAFGGLGKHQEQKELLERALKIQEKHYDFEHFELAITLSNLGIAFGSLGNHQKKKELLERALTIQERYYGPEHFLVAGTLENLGTAYRDLGDPQKAKELLELTLPIFERHYGIDHFELIPALGSLADTCGELGDHQKQKELLLRLVPILVRHYGGLERQYGRHHFCVSNVLARLGETYRYLGDHRKAKEAFEELLTVGEKHYGPDHFEVGTMLANLGHSYGKLGHHEKEKDLLVRALDNMEKHSGTEHIKVVSTLVQLACAYGVTGDQQKCKELLERALPNLERHNGHQLALSIENFLKCKK